MNTKQVTKVRLPHGWNKEIQKMANCSPTTVTNTIQAGDIDHPAWKAYEQLLNQAVAKKKAQEARIADANKLLSEIAA